MYNFFSRKRREEARRQQLYEYSAKLQNRYSVSLYILILFKQLLSDKIFLEQDKN
jgi:hypothetical protein